MSQPAALLYPEGPSLQGILTTPPSVRYLAHRASANARPGSSASSNADSHGYASPSPPAFAFLASTPTAAMDASPATVYSDRLLYQGPSAPVPSDRHAGHHHHHSSSGGVPNPVVTTVPIEFVRAHAKGTVRFPPFEDGLDDAARAAMAAFQIYPFGDIADYCRHIPYASGKKDFYEKTGRESFEVFQYVFKAPGDDKEYHVMWDYNVGLVRMTPFFKCCKYSKTMPAKMLGLNPGLREITHSITGGSIMAQGYWMPYACAKAVCATFCYRIAGALVPIFGPDFPAACLSPQAPAFGRMVIDKALVQQATRDTERMRQVTLRDATSATAKALPFHQIRHQPRRQSLDLADRYDGGYDRRYDDRHDYYRDVVDAHYRDADMQASLPPPATRPAQHTHARSDSFAHPLHAQGHERGPQLAPLRYVAHRGALLPSPIEHERLPSFAHIASLTSVGQPDRHQERGPTTLPSLVVRDEHLYSPSHDHSYAQSHAGTHVYQQHAYYGLRHPAARVETRGSGYEDDIRYQADASGGTRTNAADTHVTSFAQSETGAAGYAKHTRWMSQASQGSEGPQGPLAAECVGECCSDTLQEHRFAPSSCYPSPPRLPPLEPYETAAAWRRPSPYRADSGSGSGRRGSVGHRKATSASALVPRRRQQHLQNTADASAQRTQESDEQTVAGHDADAALLVHLRDEGDVHDNGYGDERVEDSIHVKTSPPPQPRPLHAQPKRHAPTGERSAASIASLLCDEASPRKRSRLL